MSGNHNDAGRPSVVMPSAPTREMRYVPSTSDAHPWMEEAACLGWHPVASDRDVSEEDRKWLEWVDLPAKVAKSICSECPVSKACLERAMNMRPLPSDGVWGGATWREVRSMVAPTTYIVKAEVAA